MNSSVEVSREELEQNFAERDTYLLEFAERLANLESPGLMCVCYSGDRSNLRQPSCPRTHGLRV